MQGNNTAGRLVDLVAEGTMRAAALMVQDGRFPQVQALQQESDEGYLARVTEALRGRLKANLDGYMQELRDAVEARMPESMLRTILNVQCNHAAALALRALEGELEASEARA